jgi:hypothetical protein
MMAKATTGKTHPPLVVRYYKRMKKQKVYTAQVSWQSPPSKGKSAEPYTVRLVAPGAQVVPTERIMDPAKATDKAIFYVTPIAAKGQLRGERLEVLQQGQKVQEIALPARISSIRWFWIFLLLAFLVPCLLINKVQDPSGGKALGFNDTQWSKLKVSVDKSLDKHTPIPTVVKGGKVSQHLSEDVDEALKNFVVVGYDVLNQDTVMYDGNRYHANIPFWTGVAFLVLAVLAWLLGREKRRKAVGKPVPIAE